MPELWETAATVTPYTLLNNPAKVVSPTSTVTVAAAPRPGYLQAVQNGYGNKITRIGGDFGQPTAIGGTWGRVALHHYSKDQPWNDNMSMIYIEQRSVTIGGTYYAAPYPTKMILDGSSYLPIIGNKNCNNNNAMLNASSEFRWRPGYPEQAIGWNSGSQILTVFKVVSQEIVYQVHIPNACKKGALNVQGEGFGLLSEGVISNSGRYVALCSSWLKPQVTGLVDFFCVVDIEAGIAGHHYPNQASSTEFAWQGAGVGPMNYVPMKYITQDAGDIDFCSVTPTSSSDEPFVVIKYSSNQTPEYARAFDCDPTDFMCGPLDQTGGTNPLHPTVFDSFPPGSTDAEDKRGWLACMSHGDYSVPVNAVDFGDVGVTEVYVGGLRPGQAALNHCSSAEVAALGHVVAQSMQTGQHVHISIGDTALGGGLHEAEDQHCSGRCYKTPTKVLVTYSMENMTNKLADQMVFWSVVSGGTPIRCGTTRTDDTSADPGGNPYCAEAHAVPSPGCEKIMFASSWQKNANPAGPVGDYKSYILEPDSLPGAPAVTYERGPERLAQIPQPDDVTSNVPSQ